MRRSATVAVLSALLAGVGAGAVVVSATDAPSAAATRVAADLQVVSTWSGRLQRGIEPVRLQSGFLQNDPGRGFVLVQEAGLKPAFFSTPEHIGAFRLTAVSSDGWTFRSSYGALLLVSPGYFRDGEPPSFTYLGRRLNPERLGPIGSRGVAVAYGYGPWTKNGVRAKNDVVLVERTTALPGWKLYGYLEGFTLPRTAAAGKLDGPLLGGEQELQQPLLGPDGALYSIDAKKERLVPAHGGSASVRSFTFGRCTTWPGRGGASYRACPNTISFREARGSRSTLLRRHLGKFANGRSWVFLQPSPNGRWLLAEDAYGACGIASWAYFLPSHGGELAFAFPAAYISQALGWLPDNTALVASEGCGGGSTSGIYQVWPGNAQFVRPPQLVFPGYVGDATTWGSGARPAR
jgi:hypothetical protein